MGGSRSSLEAQRPTQLPVFFSDFADHQEARCRLARQASFPVEEMRAVMLPFTVLHQIDAPLRLQALGTP